MSIDLNLSETEEQLLEQKADELGVSVEMLMKQWVNRLLKAKALSFDEALQYTMEKNAELYRRLA